MPIQSWEDHEQVPIFNPGNALIQRAVVALMDSDFDLHNARMRMHNCPCPNHGVEDCDCQMVVLLVYGKTQEPVTLILHGNNGQTWLSISDCPDQRSETELSTEIKQVLEKVSVSISPLR